MLRLAPLAALALAGCYLSHERAPRDAGPAPRDAPPIARDAPAPDAAVACCARWDHVARVAIDDFDDDAVTPRMITLEGEPALVLTGPTDPGGPSGAHLVRFSRDLAARTRPVPVTLGSFTWGQPASTGGSLAVCWGNGSGDVARLYDASGAPLAPAIVLDARASSPCLDAAFDGARFAFAYVHPADVGPAAALRVRALEGDLLHDPLELELPAGQAISMTATPDGFAVAIPGPETTVALLPGGTALGGGLRTGPSRAVRLLWDGARLVLVRVHERTVAGDRTEDVWTYQTIEDRPIELELGTFEPPPSPRFAATIGPCAMPLLGTTPPALAVIEPDGARSVRLHTYLPDGGDPGPVVGDSSVLAIDRDAYVAFASTPPGATFSRIHVDRWTCAP